MTTQTRQHFHIFAYGAQGTGVSGGDRIFIEIARRLSRSEHVHIWLSEEGREMCTRMRLPSEGIEYHVSNLAAIRNFGTVLYNISLVVQSVLTGLFAPIDTTNSEKITVYSASEFWMDSLPTLLWKLRKSSIVWIASWYQTAPSPLKGFSLQGSPRHRIASVPYWFFQKTTKPYISHFANALCVNNASEKSEFPRHAKRKKIFIMYGAVDIELTDRYVRKFKRLTKTYDAVFQGRFHPQKGVEELIDIWNVVLKSRPKARLAMIGDGPLMKSVVEKIKEYKIEKAIDVLGYVFDGDKKYKTFAMSKVVVHPSYYDSGGMASAEAMAFGLPVVGFNLPSYADYYPQGMIKVNQEDKKAFAKAIVKLLSDRSLYKKTAADAKKMVYEHWSWNKRVDDFWEFNNSL